jgi:tRNA1Val (adenine37-N6)-methyltransferase
MSKKFRLKNFQVQHELSSMKVGTDAFVLGAWLKVGDDVKQILDVGTGCGIIALFLAQKTKAFIDAIDIDKASIDEASLNFKQSPWSNRLRAIHSSVQDFKPEQNKKYDLIVSNPPFFSQSLLPDSERLKLAKHTTNFPMDVFIRKSFDMLNVDGKLAVILPVDESVGFLKQSVDTGFYVQGILEIFPKTGKPVNRKVMLLSKIASEMPVSENLIIRHEQGGYTDQYKALTKEFHAEGYI